MTDKLPAMGPGDEFEYRIGASGLLSEGETLLGTSTVTVTGATKGAVTIDDDALTVWISGAAAGTPIFVSASLKTSGGRTFARLYVIPYGEPVSLELAKAQCSIDESDDTFDTLIATYISAARAWVENYTGKILARRTVTDQHRRFCGWFDLNWGPFNADTVEVAYTDSDGAAQTVASVTMNGGRVYPAYNASWPSVRLNTGVRVTYTAGYAEGEVPDALVQAMLLLIGFWFANREAVNVGNITSELPFAVEALAGQYRDARL